MGDLRSIEIPRPINDHDNRPYIGRVFLEYSTIDDARSARSVSLMFNIAIECQEICWKDY